MKKPTANHKLITDRDGNYRYQFFCDISGALEYTSLPVDPKDPQKALEKVWMTQAKEHFNLCSKCGKWVNTVMYNADVLACVICIPWETAPKYCPHCGKKVRGTENHCSYCGKLLMYEEDV